MTTLFKLTNSIFGAQGQSSQLVERFAASWLEKNPGAKVIARDTGINPPPYLEAPAFLASRVPAADRTPEQNKLLEYSDSLIEELRQADVIVIGLPMYNFGMPAGMKSWFDHIARVGVTFMYTPNGPRGLLPAGKKCYIVATRGGLYAGTTKDTQTPHVTNFLSLIGITDIQFIYAEGLNIPELKGPALEGAGSKLSQWLG
ncbi:MAG: NAD(P)H-dependent oxidoreductase [Pseudomonadota bacterium]